MAGLSEMILSTWSLPPVLAQAPDPAPATEEPARPDASGRVHENRLPEPRTAPHALALPDRTLALEATAGAMMLTVSDGEPEAEIGYVVYMLEKADPGGRPVTFVVNGGPGAASAFLHPGVHGPWDLPMEDESIVPPEAANLAPNPETWLDFTDLVFIDPVGTGFSRLIDPDDRTRDRYLSVEGDIDALADFVRRWLTESGRTRSSKYFVGESYGGFRGPLLAKALGNDHGVAVDGMFLVSPVLDFGWWEQPDHAPLPSVSLLPSLAAAAMEERGTLSEKSLGVTEAYEASMSRTCCWAFRTGPRSTELSSRLRGSPVSIAPFVERAAGRIDRHAFAREFRRDEGRLVSPYDTTVSSADPSPRDPIPRAHDPVLDAMTAPLTNAMLAHYRETLDWLPERPYRLLTAGWAALGTGVRAAASPRPSERSHVCWRSIPRSGCSWSTATPIS